MTEIIVTNLSKTLEEDRLDADFYRGILPKNKNMQYKKIRDKDVTGFIQYGISIDMNESGVGYRIYRMNEIENMFCSDSVSKYVDIPREEMQKFKLKNNDILFNRTNSFEFVGRTGIFKEFSKEDFVFASYLVRFRTNEKLVLPEYLTVFLNTKFGISEIKRRARISINQSNVSASELQKIEIPIIEMPLQEKIRDALNDAFKILQESKSLYSEAEGLLIEELELKDYTIGKALAFEDNMNDLTISKRFDADYFQPKYKEIIKKIERYDHGSAILGNIVKIKDKNFLPKENALYKYIELSNIVGQGEIDGCILERGEELPTRARRLIHEGDLIISSIEGSLSCCALIHKEHDDCLCSNGFFVLKSEIMNPETLLILFKSEILQNLLKRGCAGTILTAINRDELEKIPLPLIDKNIQEQISLKIKEAHKLRLESKQLLEEAKKIVENAVKESS